MLVAWTGHRPDLFAHPAAAQAAVTTLADEFARRESTLSFVVGGQRGVDTWAARAAIARGVAFTLILPLEVAQFARDWPAADRHALDLILAAAGEVRVVGGAPERAFTERNRLLVAEADLLVAVWTGVSGGGTAETIAFARANVHRGARSATTGPPRAPAWRAAAACSPRRRASDRRPPGYGGIGLAAVRSMIEYARPQVRARSAHSERFNWGLVDIILAVLMLPFGLAALLIERLVWAVTAAFNE